MKPALSVFSLDGIPPVAPGDDLFALLCASLDRTGLRPLDGDVLVLAQKIVSKAEGRQVELHTVAPSAEALRIAGRTGKDARLVELILRESVRVLRCRHGVIIVEHRLGYVHANAGIDRSNVEGADSVLLLPEDPDASARRLRARFAAERNVDLCVVVSDSTGRAWREGTVALALGTAGFEPVTDLVGRPDLFGHALQTARVAVADEVAAAASLVIGEAAEGTPAALVRGVRLVPAETGSGALLRDPDRDLFR